MQPLRREMQMIFQDPYASLNPRQRVGQIVGDPLRLHGLASGEDLKRNVQELLERVGLGPEHYNRYPHEFSGGQRQRIGIARALALRPRLIIADEPVSALDVSIQAQIINLLEDLQDDFKLTYIFVAHDLGVIRHVSDRIAVMYLGKIVELGPADEVYSNPIHPYTLSLLSALPIPDPQVNAAREPLVLEGDLPSPANPPAACRFHTRCPYATEICSEVGARADPPRQRALGGLPPPSRPRGPHGGAQGASRSSSPSPPDAATRWPRTLILVLVMAEALLISRGPTRARSRWCDRASGRALRAAPGLEGTALTRAAASDQPLGERRPAIASR